MKCSTSCCLLLVGGGFVAGAMVAANSKNVREWFATTSKKLSKICDDVASKINESVVSCNCSNMGDKNQESEQKMEQNTVSKTK